MTLVHGHFGVVSPPGSYDCVVTAAGEIDLDTAVQLRQVLREALQDRPRTLTVDMADVSFIDSTGLGVLVGAFKTGQTMDVDLVIRAPSATVVRVFELTRLDQVLHIIPGSEAAAPIVT